MYQKNKRTQYNECLICHTALLKEISITHLLQPIPLCHQCLQKFQIINLTIDFHHHTMKILYQYDEFFKSLLFQYKGLYDIALKDSFLCLYFNEFLFKYKDYTIVVAPSSQHSNEVRGFSPVATIASSFSKQVFTGLYKKEDYKQSDYTYEQRKEVIHKIGINHGEFLTNKKVLIFDDVLTSSSTMFACLKLVAAYKPKSIEFLILATNQTKEQIQKAIADQTF